jgi:hypothetical protein
MTIDYTNPTVADLAAKEVVRPILVNKAKKVVVSEFPITVYTRGWKRTSPFDCLVSK